jgi:pimeloyl-ACP methyl ester carboxylesterase
VASHLRARDLHLTLATGSVHVLEWGETRAGAPDVVLLHGGGLTSHTWDGVGKALAAEYHCLAIDLLGHGDTDWASDGDYRLEVYAGQVLEALTRLGVPATNAVVVGQSLGGLVSLLVVARHWSDALGLVLIDVGPEVGGAGGRRIMDFMATSAALGTIDEIAEVAVKFNPKRRLATLRVSLEHNLRRDSTGRWAWKYDPAQFSSRWREQRLRERQAMWADVDLVTAPVLVVRGEESDVFLEADAAKLAARLARASLVVIPGAGHAVQGDQPEHLAARLGEFLRTVSRCPVTGGGQDD